MAKLVQLGYELLLHAQCLKELALDNTLVSKLEKIVTRWAEVRIE